MVSIGVSGPWDGVWATAPPTHATPGSAGTSPAFTFTIAHPRARTWSDLGMYLQTLDCGVCDFVGFESLHGVAAGVYVQFELFRA